MTCSHIIPPSDIPSFFRILENLDHCYCWDARVKAYRFLCDHRDTEGGGLTIRESAKLVRFEALAEVRGRTTV